MNISQIKHAMRRLSLGQLRKLDERLHELIRNAEDAERAALDKLALTQEFIAMMLGVRRAGITSAASTLQGDGFIRYSRGRITILDSPGLEEFSCEYYQIVRAETDRLLKA